MACQIKHSITATEKDKTFQEVICAAWNDFNKEDFDRDRDRIALVTAQISNKAQQSLRFLHVEAIGAIDAEAFMERIDVPVFSNNDNQKMLVAIKECISLAKGCEPTNEEVWKFCKAFILLLFDMDCAESVNRALSASWSMQVNAIRWQHLLVKKILTEIYEIYFQKIILFSFHLIR